MSVRSWEHWRVHSFSRRWTLLVRPIFSLIVPGVVGVGLEVRAFRSRAAQRASLTLRGCGGGRSVLFLPGGVEGNRDEAMSRRNGGCALAGLALWGVTQNM